MKCCWRNTQSHYGCIAKFFHWLLALLIIGMLIFGNILDDITDKALKTQAINLHKSFGLLILGLVVLRICWTLSNQKPMLPAHVPPLLKSAAQLGHFLLYLSIFCMPISGILLSTYAGHPPGFFGLFTLHLPISSNKAMAHSLEEVHAYLGWTIVTLLCLHIAAALFHHFFYKDHVLKRMLPGSCSKDK